MADKPVECSVPTHDWEEISIGTVLTIVFRMQKGGPDVPGDLTVSVFKCKKCKLVRFFSKE